MNDLSIFPADIAEMSVSQLAQTMFAFSGQARAQKPLVQRPGLIAAQLAINPCLAQLYLRRPLRQVLQVGQAGVQLAFLGHVIGQVQ